MFMVDLSIQSDLQTASSSAELTLNRGSAFGDLRWKLRIPQRRPCQIPWYDASMDSDELLKMKQFETLPKLCWQSRRRQTHFLMRYPRNDHNATVPNSQF